MKMRTRYLIVVALLVASSCTDKPRRVDGSDETGTTGGSSSSGGESSGSDASGSGGSDTSSGPAELGVSGILIFEPVPEFSPESEAVLSLLVYLVEQGKGELVKEVAVPVSASPTEFFIPVEPDEYLPEHGYYLVGFGDVNGDHEENCGDYYTAGGPGADPAAPEQVIEVVLEYADYWCP